MNIRIGVLASVLAWACATGSNAQQLDGTCHTEAELVSGGGLLVTQPMTTCGDGTPCGYVLVYRPPRTTCKLTVADTCCVRQLQHYYTQNWVCTPTPSGNTTTCTGAAFVHYWGPAVVVYTTVACVDQTTCLPPPPFPSGLY